MSSPEGGFAPSGTGGTGSVSITSPDSSIAVGGTPSAPTVELPATGAAPGTYGDASDIPVIQVDAKGRIIAISTTGGSQAALVPNPALVGQQAQWDGHSYVTGLHATGSYGYVQRVNARQIYLSATINAVAGNWMVDTCSKVNWAGTGRGVAGFMRVCDSVINDVNASVSGNTSGRSGVQSRTSYKNNLRVYLWLARQDSSRPQRTASANATLTGTWAQDTTSNSGNYPTTARYTTTQNDNAVFTYTTGPGETTALLFLFGIDNTNSGMTGATFSVAGATPAVATTANQYLRGLGSANGAAGSAWVAGAQGVLLTGLTANASNTITVTKTDATGSRLWVEGIIRPPATIYTPVWLVLAAPVTFNGITNTDVANYNADLASVVAEFPTPSQIFTIDPTSGPSGWSTATDLYSGDGLHPNDRGYDLYAGVVNTALNQFPYTAGINSL